MITRWRAKLKHSELSRNGELYDVSDRSVIVKLITDSGCGNGSSIGITCRSYVTSKRMPVPSVKMARVNASRVDIGRDAITRVCHEISRRNLMFPTSSGMLVVYRVKQWRYHRSATRLLDASATLRILPGFFRYAKLV